MKSSIGQHEFVMSTQFVIALIWALTAIILACWGLPFTAMTTGFLAGYFTAKPHTETTSPPKQ